jgi:hypothetical protein
MANSPSNTPSNTPSNSPSNSPSNKSDDSSSKSNEALYTSLGILGAFFLLVAITLLIATNGGKNI